MTEDLSETQNVIDQYPEVAARLAEGYERWCQSLMDEGVNERYAYIKVGSPYENPTRICSHDMLTGRLGQAWHQYGAITAATQATGRWKIEFVEDGEYTISLRRFPRESGLAINETFPGVEKTIEIDRVMPAGEKSDFEQAFLYVADVQKSAKIEEGQDEVTFKVNLSAGKYDLEAQLIDKYKRVYPAYYLYIEKM